MKVFSYNPVTGTRGEQIDNIKRASWTDQSVDFQVSHNIIEPINCKVPSVRRQEWTVHVDAGISGEDLKGISYQRDEWICFCLGEFICGEDEGVWDWVILPPKSAVKSIA